MALSNEDHKDVKKAMGKAVANKIRNVTRDGSKKMSVDASQKQALKIYHKTRAGQVRKY